MKRATHPCPHCTNDRKDLMERIADLSAPSEKPLTAVQILCHVCAKSFVVFKEKPRSG